MNDVVQMNTRLSQLENDSSSIKAKMDTMNGTQQAIAESLALMAVAQENVAVTLGKVNETMERFRDFEVRTETERKNERDHRDRLDRRVDDMQRDLMNTRKDFEEGIDRVYSSIRKVDKTCIQNYNDLDKRLDVKTNVDDIKQENTIKTIDLRGDRLWKVVFWFITFLMVVVYGVYKK